MINMKNNLINDNLKYNLEKENEVLKNTIK